MALPKKKLTRARRGKRRGSHKKINLTLKKCPQCKKLIPPHQVCTYCGTYKGRTILDLQAKDKKKKERQKKKRETS